MKDLSRRQFLQVSSGAALGAGVMLGRAALAQEPAPATPAVSANDKIVIGLVGVAGRGSGHVTWFGRHPDVEIGAICDLYQPHIDNALEQAKNISQGKANPKILGELIRRRLLA